MGQESEGLTAAPVSCRSATTLTTETLAVAAGLTRQLPVVKARRARSRFDRIVVMDAALRPIGDKIGLELMVRHRRRGRGKPRGRQRLDHLRHLGRLYLHVFAGKVTGRPAPSR